MVYIDGRFVKHKILVKPILITLQNLTTAVSGKAAAAWRVLGMMPSLRKSATLEQTDTWRVGGRLVMAARVMVPAMKCELDWYEYTYKSLRTFHPKNVMLILLFF